MKTLLTVTATLEGATGVALLLAPALVVSVLLGGSLDEPAGILLGRLAGIALVSLAIVCWMEKNEPATGVVKALLFYNVAAAGLLAYGAVTGISGLAVWPVVVLHVVMGVWCLMSIKKK